LGAEVFTDKLTEREHLATANQTQPFNEVVRYTTSATAAIPRLVKNRFILVIKAEKSFHSLLHINRQFCAVHHTHKNKV
jgi:hypothetical protein